MRLTEKRDGKNVIPLRKDGKVKWALNSAGMEDAPTRFLYGDYADKLAEYEDLEEQGKLIKLPCVVGDTYYRIENDGANHPYITEWEVRTTEFCVNARNSVGKNIFLTREEAEATLKDMKG